ncbi:glutathione S-transferase T3-like [Mercurialis annua]|uniref:glutathione S-transferase T3-like n=1 Tax=Mercurialis annua TaxID=3986 RepID=UPI00215FCB21|nr:glutathione S-transferase T3-like [Mercurialis annua]
MNFQYGDNENFIDLSLNSQFPTQIPISNNTSTSTELNSKKSRGGKFSIDEDLLIVSSWLNISLDAVQGNEQKHKTYWARLWEYFHKYKNFPSERTQLSLMNRWSTIQLATNKFCGCYAQIESRHQSGVNEQDKIANAKFLYQQLNKIKFQFEHCWNILRLQPKWMEDCQKKKPIKKKDIDNVVNLNTSSETEINSRDDNIANSNFVDLERPPGRKAEKDKKKRKLKDMEIDSTSSYVNLLQEMRDEKKQFNEKKLEMFEKAYVQGQNKLDYQKEKLRLEQIKEDERMMATDITGMPEMLANFYIQCQKEIIERRSKNY